MTKILPISKARADLPNLIDRANKNLDEFVITVKGFPSAVVIPFSEYESWKETNDIMADTGLMKSIKRGENDFKKGRWESWDKVKKDLKINV